MTLTKLSMKWKQDQGQRECTGGCQGGGDKRELNWEFEISRCKQVCIEQISSKVLLFNTGSYIQYFVINHNGKEYEKQCVCVYIHIYI